MTAKHFEGRGVLDPSKVPVQVPVALLRKSAKSLRAFLAGR